MIFKISVKAALKPFLLHLSLVISAAHSATDYSLICLKISSWFMAEDAKPVGREGYGVSQLGNLGGTKRLGLVRLHCFTLFITICQMEHQVGKLCALFARVTPNTSLNGSKLLNAVA